MHTLQNRSTDSNTILLLYTSSTLKSVCVVMWAKVSQRLHSTTDLYSVKENIIYNKNTLNCMCHVCYGYSCCDLSVSCDLRPAHVLSVWRLTPHLHPASGITLGSGAFTPKATKARRDSIQSQRRDAAV